MATNEELMFIEKVGLNFEQLTLPRMAGRIFGWLLISESPLVSMSELVEVLQASKSSISSMTRLLIQIKLIELVSLPGERRDFYRIDADAWTNSLRARLAQAQTFRSLADEGLALLVGSNPERRRRLEEMHSLYAFIESEIPEWIERWQIIRKEMES